MTNYFPIEIIIGSWDKFNLDEEFDFAQVFLWLHQFFKLQFNLLNLDFLLSVALNKKVFLDWMNMLKP